MKKIILIFSLCVSSSFANALAEHLKKQTAAADLETLEAYLEAYKLNGKFYPTTEQGLGALIDKPEKSPLPRRWTQALSELPRDPWGRIYHYRQIKGKPYIWSTGPDLKTDRDDIYLPGAREALKKAMAKKH